MDAFKTLHPEAPAEDLEGLGWRKSRMASLTFALSLIKLLAPSDFITTWVTRCWAIPMIWAICSSVRGS